MEDRQLSFFQSLLWHVVNGQQGYKEFVNPIIEDIQSLVNGTKDYFNIDRDNYHIIVSLAESEPDFFRQINLANITIADYQHINELLAEQQQMHFV
jgi:chloramphenicol O-acetyltransferase